MWGQIFNLQNPLISADNTWLLWAICALGAATAIYLEQRFKWASKMTGAILALIFAITLSNLGIIPMNAPVWDAVWDYVVPLAIPLLLLQCDMRKIGKDAGKLLILFLIGSVGTALGSLLGYSLLKGTIPELEGLAGIFTGTYIGGTVNFAALSAAFEVSGEMISAATVADNLMMVMYFFILIAMPVIPFFRKHFTHPHVDAMDALSQNEKNHTPAASYWDEREMSLKDIALASATSFTIVALSNMISAGLGNVIPTTTDFLEILNTIFGNLYLWITTLSMLCATLKPDFFGEIKGTEELGTYLIYLFFFVIGVPASVPLIIVHSPLLLLFAAIVIAGNMSLTLLGGKLLKFDLEEIILASNANIGGPTTAVAMAVSKGWSKLVGPVLLVGTLGYVLGTYFGLIVGSILGI